MTTDEIMAAIRRVIDAGRFVDGPEVEGFERDFGELIGAHVVGCNSGHDAARIINSLGILSGGWPLGVFYGYVEWAVKRWFPAAIHFGPDTWPRAFGDAGVLVTNDPDLAEDFRRLARYGSNPERGRVIGHTFHLVRGQHGCNSRLDAIQAAILRRSLSEGT